MVTRIVAMTMIAETAQIMTTTTATHATMMITHLAVEIVTVVAMTGKKQAFARLVFINLSSIC